MPDGSMKRCGRPLSKKTLLDREKPVRIRGLADLRIFCPGNDTASLLLPWNGSAWIDHRSTDGSAQL